MKKNEFERLKKIALKRIEEKSVKLSQNFRDKDADELTQINEIYQAELEAQNEELQNHILDLEEAQQELQILFTQAPIPYVLMTTKFNILRANEEATKLFGVDTIFSKSIPFYTYIHKKYITIFLDWINKKKNFNTSIEILLKTTKGLRYCKLHFQKWANENSDIILLSIDDIHAQREESDKFKSLFNNSQHGIIFFDETYQIKNVNDRALNILGFIKEDFLEKDFTELDITFYDESKREILYQDLPFFMAINIGKIQSNKIVTFKNSLTNEYIVLEMEAIPHFSIQNEKLIGVFCIFTDISKEYKLNHELNQQLNNFKTLGDNIPDKIFRIDKEQNILFLNKNALEFLEESNTQLINKKLSDISLFKSQRAKELNYLINDLDKLDKTITYSLNSIDTNKNYFIRIIPEYVKDLNKTFLIIIEDITQRVETENMFNQLFYNSSDAIVLTEHKTGLIKSINAKARKLLDIKEENISSYDSKQIFEAFESEIYFKNHIESLNKNGEDSYETKKILNNGQVVYLKVFCNLLKIGNQTYHQSIIHDLTEHKLLERQLNQTSKVFQHTVEGILITDLKGRIISVNNAFTKITGYSREEILFKNPSILKSGKHDKSFYKKMWFEISKNGLWKGEIWNKKKDGTIYPEWLAISPIYDENNKPIQYVGVFSDFSEIKKNQLQLEELAHYDALTGLPNRLLLYSELTYIIKVSKRQKTRFAVLFLDLDRFKNINDTYGHNTGDKVLKETSYRIKRLIRESDIVARIGGDEFVIVLSDIKTEDDIKRVSQSLLNELEKPFLLDGKEHFISGSIGSSLYPDDSINIDSLLRYADIAMYESKDSGKNKFTSFSMDMSEKANNISNLHNDLKQGLNNDQFYLVYQPQYNIQEKKIYGFEALIRWNHPIYKDWSPENYIKYAEESNIIIEIGNWVLEQAIIDLQKINSFFTKNFTISINVSHMQLNEKFVDYLVYILKKYHNISNNIKIEITETAAMKNVISTKKIIKQIKELGFKISLDDFGTGYSALNSIKMLSVDEIKIDRSFIKDVPGDKEDEELVNSIIAMAKVMKKEIIAEGVETKETKDFLLERRCFNIQGFLISKPLTLENLLDMDLISKIGI
jgi:diguanylate cyclase (GGDEF)-like protein/PAS domain S-box-containing protein